MWKHKVEDVWVSMTHKYLHFPSYRMFISIAEARNDHTFNGRLMFLRLVKYHILFQERLMFLSQSISREVPSNPKLMLTQ